MNLNKENWEIVKFEKLVSNISERVEPQDTTLTQYIGLEHLDTGQIKIQRFGSPGDVIGTKLKVYKDDIIFGKRRAYQRKAAVADFDAICSAHAMVLRANKETIDASYLIAFMHSDLFMNRAIEISEGSLSPTIKWKTLAKQVFPIPSMKEQLKIASLFRSIEQNFVALSEHERRLKKLQKTLVNGLLAETPVFGSLLNKKKCLLTKFADIATCDKKYPEHENPVDRFIGLENIEPENFKLQGYGSIENGTTFTKHFVAGDVLFGKRRAYLKKVAIADFNGLCSGDILVLRAKEKLVLSKLLPFYVSADAFMLRAVSTSAGSLSPRTKWKDLSDLQFSIPDLETQEKIVYVLENILKNIHLLAEQKNALLSLKKKLFREILG